MDNDVRVGTNPYKKISIYLGGKPWEDAAFGAKKYDYISNKRIHYLKNYATFYEQDFYAQIYEKDFKKPYNNSPRHKKGHKRK